MIIYLDTNIVIYAVEQNPIFGPKARTRLAAAQAAGDSLMISDLNANGVPGWSAEVWRCERTRRLSHLFKVTNVVAITATVCDRAAHIRATYNFKSMDSLHLAAAVEHGAAVFLTADTRLNSFTGLAVEVLR